MLFTHVTIRSDFTSATAATLYTGSQTNDKKFVIKCAYCDGDHKSHLCTTVTDRVVRRKGLCNSIETNRCNSIETNDLRHRLLPVNKNLNVSSPSRALGATNFQRREIFYSVSC